MNVLVTGGAGFIGTHVVRRLLRENCNVTILDNFSPQIHGGDQGIAPDLRGKVNVLKGSVTDKKLFELALHEQEIVVHLAAETGTGQSMYSIENYENVNIKGTALLVDYIVNNAKSKVKKIVIASSRAIYGEGKYLCQNHGVVYPEKRTIEDIRDGRFEPLCPVCASECAVVPTTEDSRINPLSFYGITKQVQEQMVLLFAKTMGISGFALRYQNVYGPGQSLKNPYTGILAVFSNQARQNKPIYVFEDGHESRDFVYIDDVVDATWRCICPDVSGVDALNIGSGVRTSIMEVVHEVVRLFGSKSDVLVTGAFREGDIRHNVADLQKASNVICFGAKWKFADGLTKFLSWAEQQDISSSKYESSLNELRDRGLMHG